MLCQIWNQCQLTKRTFLFYFCDIFDVESFVEIKLLVINFKAVIRTNSKCKQFEYMHLVTLFMHKYFRTLHWIWYIFFKELRRALRCFYFYTPHVLVSSFQSFVKICYVREGLLSFFSHRCATLIWRIWHCKLKYWRSNSLLN